MPNGDEYARMESEADRILYGKVVELEKELAEAKSDTKAIHRRIDVIIGLLITVLGGLLYSITGGS